MSSKPRLFILEDDLERMTQVCDILRGWDIDHASSVEAAKALWKPPYLLLMLDHDLGGTQYAPSDSTSGAAFATWVSPKLTIRDRVVVHSYNPDGARNIGRIISDGKGFPLLLPFSVNFLKDLQRMYGPSTPKESR